MSARLPASVFSRDDWRFFPLRPRATLRHSRPPDCVPGRTTLQVSTIPTAMKTPLLTAIASLAIATSASSANLLVNGSFEAPLTFDGAPFVGFWEGFSSGGTATATTDTNQPRTGASNGTLSILGADNAFAGIFQDVSVTPGTQVIFSGWHATPSSPLDVGIEFRLEWRNSGTNSEVSRTPNSTTAPGGAAYQPFSLVSTVPAGADTARVVYAIQTFGGDGPTNTGVVRLDDLSFDVVPEPGTTALLGLLAGVGAWRRRR